MNRVSIVQVSFKVLMSGFLPMLIQVLGFSWVTPVTKRFHSKRLITARICQDLLFLLHGGQLFLSKSQADRSRDVTPTPTIWGMGNPTHHIVGTLNELKANKRFMSFRRKLPSILTGGNPYTVAVKSHWFKPHCLKIESQFWLQAVTPRCLARSIYQSIMEDIWTINI